VKNSLLKLATVVSSVLLLSGFVCYRAGAFHWLIGASARPADSVSSPTVGQSPAAPGEAAGTIMPGSKSMVISDFSSFAVPVPSSGPEAQPAVPSQQPVAPPAPAPVILPGSKDMVPLIVPPSSIAPGCPTQQAAPEGPPQTIPPVILPSSKSGGIFLPTPSKPATKPAAPAQQVAPAPTQPPPVLLPGPKSAEIFTPSTKPVSRP
jgi:hypothetical protein